MKAVRYIRYELEPIDRECWAACKALPPKQAAASVGLTLTQYRKHVQDAAWYHAHALPGKFTREQHARAQIEAYETNARKMHRDRMKLVKAHG